MSEPERSAKQRMRPGQPVLGSSMEPLDISAHVGASDGAMQQQHSTLVLPALPPLLPRYQLSSSRHSPAAARWTRHLRCRASLPALLLLLACMGLRGAAAQGNCAVSNTCNPASQQCDPITGICCAIGAVAPQGGCCAVGEVAVRGRCCPRALLCGPAGAQSCCRAPYVCVGGSQCVNLGSTASQFFVPAQIATQQQLQSDRPTCAGDTRFVGGVCCPSDSVCLSACCAATQQCFRGSICCALSQQCGSACCATGQVCVGRTTCCPSQQACGTTCCPAGSTCVNGACCPTSKTCGSATNKRCCAADRQCDPITGQCCLIGGVLPGGGCCNPASVCGPNCCQTGQSCLGQQICCSQANICGSSCCMAGQTCLQSGNTGVCCSAGQIVCAGQCCTGQCIGSVCCSDPSLVCQQTCCQAGSQCLLGRCCPATQVCNQQCCPSGSVCINNQCAPPGSTPCGMSFCLAGQVCAGGSGQCCAAGQTLCGGQCCSGTCVGNLCCPAGSIACGSQCCTTGNCVNGQCVAAGAFACGSTVCQSGSTCCGSVCCAGGQSCVNGMCCTPGQWGCGGNTWGNQWGGNQWSGNTWGGGVVNPGWGGRPVWGRR